MTSFHLAIVLSAFMQSAPAPGAPPPAAILGQWESAVRNKGGVGNILEFHPDGRVTQISAAMGDTTYEVQGEWLRTFYTDEATGEVRESALKVEFEGSDRLRREGRGRGRAELVRADRPVRSADGFAARRRVVLDLHGAADAVPPVHARRKALRAHAGRDAPRDATRRGRQAHGRDLRPAAGDVSLPASRTASS